MTKANAKPEYSACDLYHVVKNGFDGTIWDLGVMPEEVDISMRFKGTTDELRRLGCRIVAHADGMMARFFNDRTRPGAESYGPYLDKIEQTWYNIGTE